MRKNQHRWKKSVDHHIRQLLEEGAEILAWAWSLDKESPNSFPINTEVNLHQIRREILEYQERDKPKLPRKPLHLRRARAPRCLADLVNDQTIRVVYENQNDGTYDEALRVARSGDRAASRTFRKILNALAAAYQITHFGEEAAPKPRTQYLHRALLHLADLAGLSDLTHSGMLEFFEDLCPCGDKHTAESVRKLRMRIRRRREYN